ncbi:MAG: hypothetical protein ACOC47_02035 [Alkalispirochaetaceae bacterium]
MYTSDRFQKEFRKLRKSESPEELLLHLEQRFLRYLPGLPPELGQELFSHCYERWEAGAGDLIFGDVLDLMQQQYDEENDPLSDEDWETIREIVSSHAVDLDMHLVTYIMQLVVERGHN